MDELLHIFDELLPLLARYEIYIYIILGVIAVFQFRWLVQSWHEWRNSTFGLEREIAQRHFTTPLTILILMAMLVVGEFLIVSFVVPSYPKVNVIATPTLDLVSTPAPTLDVSLTVTPTGEALILTVAAPEGDGCQAGVVEWLTPKNGDTITETIELKGTVNVANLGFYKYEYSQQGSDTWTTIAADNKPKVNGTIGFWNPSQLPAGDYRLRLVVADNQNKVLPACVINVKIGQP
jgi:hypothetical protein